MDTNSSTATATYVINPVTNVVNGVSTTITALLNGNVVYSMNFSRPFADPSVQAAVVAADAVLVGQGASPGAPMLAASSTSSTSITAPTVNPSLTCAQLSSGAYAPNGNLSTNVTTLFGPATIAVGNCMADTFAVLPGQLDVNTNADIGYDVPVNQVTTVTNITTQVYDILGLAGTPTPVAVPEPGTAALLLAGGGALALRRRGGSRLAAGHTAGEGQARA